MIYIPTQTYNLIDGEYENILYSPSLSKPKVIKAKNITIWDNHTFYYYKRYFKKDKHEKAYNHYLWLIDFIKQNWQEGIILITPDVDWLDKGEEIEKLWNNQCSKYPQLYVPNTWKTSINNLNIVGYALRCGVQYEEHPYWNHCLGHVRELHSPLQTYDAVKKLV